MSISLEGRGEFGYWRGVVERLGSGTPSQNERRAIADLRAIAEAQSQVVALGSIDADADGRGEYGLLRELSGAVGVRTNADASTQAAVIRPPLLDASYQLSNGNHQTVRQGYLLRMFLPGSSDDAIPEIRGTAALYAVTDTDKVEQSWCCYAWPARRGVTGSRSFFVDQTGKMLFANAAYSGSAAFGAANGGAAFQPRDFGPYTESLRHLGGPSAAGAIGRDGNLWRVVPDRPSSQAHSLHGSLTAAGPGSGLSGTFRIEADSLTNDTRERATVRVTNLPSGPHRVRLVATDGEAFDLGRLRLQPDGTWLLRDDAIVSDPAGDDSLARFAGGTIDVVDASDAHVARGAIPDLATPFGPPVRGASLVYRATAELESEVASDLLEGSAELRIVNQPGGRRETLTIDVTTADRAARPIDVLLVRDLGRIVPRDLDGHGRLVFDSRRGPPLPFDARALSENRIELRDETGAVIARGRFPVVE